MTLPKLDRREILKLEAAAIAAAAAGIPAPSLGANLVTEREATELKWDKAACRFCGTKRRPGWRYVSFTGKPVEPPKQPEPLYFDRFLTPPPPRAPRIPTTWPAEVLVPLRKIEVFYG